MNSLKNKITDRLYSLDVFRGFTIVGMMIVNNPGSWDHVFTQLRHAAWHGCTFADLVFPFFIWISGVAMVFSFTVRKNQGANRNQLLMHVLKRSIVLFVIGLFLNGFPFGLIESHDFSWITIRVPGVLQRIAVCYLITSLIVLYSNAIWHMIWLAFLLVGYWVLVKIIPVPGFGVGILEPMGNLAWYIDANLLNGHTWRGAPAPGFDPEGILSTLPAIATMLFGALAGYFLLSKKSSNIKTIWMLIFGGGLILVGLLMDYWLPINKNLWTSSYAVFASGIALFGFACCYWLIDIKGKKKWFKPLQIFGLNALTVYVISGLIVRLTYMIKITTLGNLSFSLKSHYYQKLFFAVKAPMLSSFMHSIVFMLFMYLVACVLYRARIKISFLG